MSSTYSGNTWKTAPTSWYTISAAATNASTSFTKLNNVINNVTFTTGTSTNIGITNSSVWYDPVHEYDVDGARLRRRPPLEFNRYINASDLLEEFIAFAGEHGARQGDVLELPVDLFVKWLIIRACEEDQEEPPDVLEPRALVRQQPRCLGCQRYMRRDVKVPMHDARCAELYFSRAA